MIQAKRRVVFQAKASHAKRNVIPGSPRLSAMVEFAKDLFSLSVFVTVSVLLMYAAYSLRVG